MVSGAATVRYPQCLRREPGGGAGGDTDEVAKFRGNADEPDRPDPASRDTPEPVGDSRSARARVEPRSRAEYAADLEQRALSGWEASGSRDADVREPPSEQVRWFEPERAGLADISPQEAAAYIDGRRDGRPWLTVAAGCPPEVQRLFAALDQGGGHGHIRHEGWITEEMNRAGAGARLGEAGGGGVVLVGPHELDRNGARAVGQVDFAEDEGEAGA